MIIPEKKGAAEFTEKRSRFISFAHYVQSEEEALRIVAETKKEYWDAKHTVFAYVLGSGNARFSDDGEPHGTAGKPVLSVIQGAGVSCCLITVTRYFGGILLGTGGLVKAYTDSARLALEDAGLAETVELSQLCCRCEYSQYENLCRLISEFGASETESDFGENVKLQFLIEKENIENFSKKLTESFSATVNFEILGEKVGKRKKNS